MGGGKVSSAGNENSKTTYMNEVVENYLLTHGGNPSEFVETPMRLSNTEMRDAASLITPSSSSSSSDFFTSSSNNPFNNPFLPVSVPMINLDSETPLTQQLSDYTAVGLVNLAAQSNLAAQNLAASAQNPSAQNPSAQNPSINAGTEKPSTLFWPFSLLHFILTCGCLCYLPAFLFLALLKNYRNKRPKSTEDDKAKPLLDAEMGNGHSHYNDSETLERTATLESATGNDSSMMSSDSWKIQICIVISDFISCLACGATIKFMNLYFINEHGFGPEMIAQLQMALPLMIAVATLSFEQFANWWSRPKVSITAQLVVAVCLALLGFTGGETEASTGGKYSFGEFQNTFQTWSRIPLFLIAAACSQASPTLDKAVLMEHTSTGQRGRLNAFLSFNGFAWKGSAFMGGYLADATGGYLFAFKCASLVYFVSALVYFPVTRMVKK